MARDIKKYWQEFSEIQDQLLANADDASKIRDALRATTQLVDRVEQESQVIQQDHIQLELWSATFHQFRAELNLDLGQVQDAVEAYHKALGHYSNLSVTGSDLEIRVGLIRTLCKAGQFEAACAEINRLSCCNASFVSSGDAESAIKVLKELCSHAEIARNVNAEVLRDVLQAVSTRGGISLSFTNVTNPVQPSNEMD